MALAQSFPKARVTTGVPATASRARTTLVSIVLTVLGRGAFLLTQVILARSLGPGGFGLYAMGWTVAGIGTIVSNAGIPQTCIRYAVGGRHLWRFAFLPLGIVSSSLVAVLIAVFSRPIATGVFSAPEAAPVIAALAPTVPLTVMLSVWTAGFKVMGRTATGIAFASVGMALGPLLLTALVFASGHHSPGLYALANSLGLVPAVILAALLGHRHFPEPEAAGFARRFRYGLQSVGAHSIGILNMWVDRLMIGLLTTAVELGHYQSASQLSMIPMMLAATVASIHEAPLARAASKSARTGEFVRSQLAQMHVVTAGCLAGALTAPTWLRLLFGADFVAAAPILSILLVSQAVRALAGPGTILLTMAGAPGASLLATVVGVLLNVALNLALIPLIGATGAAVASLIATAAISGLALWLCRRLDLMDLGVRHLAGPLASTAASLACAAAAVALVPRFPGFDLALTAVILLAYFAPMAFLDCYSRYDDLAAAVRQAFRTSLSGARP